MKSSTKYLIALFMLMVSIGYTVLMVYVFREYNLPTYSIAWFMLSIIPITLNAGVIAILFNVYRQG